MLLVPIAVVGTGTADAAGSARAAVPAPAEGAPSTTAAQAPAPTASEPPGPARATGGILGAQPVSPATGTTTALATTTAVPNTTGAPGTTVAAAAPSGRTSSDTATAPCTGTSPKGLYSGSLSFTLSAITPQAVTAGGPTTLTVTGTMTNTGQSTIDEIGYKYQRGDALVGEAAIRSEAASPCQPTSVVDSGFVGIDGALAPGASMPFRAAVPISGDPTRTLAVTDPGVYPLMINLNATVQLSSGDLRARVGEVHLLLTVLSVPPIPSQPGGGLPDGGTATGAGTDPATGTASGTASGTDTTEPGSATGTGTAGAAGTGGEPPDDSGTAAHTAIPYAMVWTLVDRPHLGVNGVFLDDDLAAQVSPGGALYDKLDVMTSTTQVANSTTLAIDPLLLDELDRMSRGYWVVAPAGSAQAPLTPTPRGTSTVKKNATGIAPPEQGSTSAADSSDRSTEQTPTAPSGDPTSTASASEPVTGAPGQSGTAPTTETTGPTGTNGTAETNGIDSQHADAATRPPGAAQPARTVAGTGQAAATAFLDHLRRLAATTPMLVLPYSDADAVALVRAGMTEDLAAAVYLGRAVAARVLGVTAAAGSTSMLITDIAYPVDGLADPATLSELRSLGATAALLAPEGVIGLPPGTAVATVSLPAGATTGAASSLTAVVPDSSLLDDIAPFLSSGAPADSAVEMNLIAGVIAGQYFADEAAPLLVVTDRNWTPNRDGLGAITSLLATMSSQGVVSGTDLRALAAAPEGSATVRYPPAAKAGELSASLLGRVREAEDTITSLRMSLATAGGPEGGDPADVLNPLEESLTPLTSASLRDNPHPATSVLSTVDSSLRGIEAGVTVATTSGSLTLASSSAPLRLTVVNSLPYDVRLRLDIGGGARVGLTITDPGVLDVPAGRSVPVKVTAHVARSGTFSITAQLLTVDGRHWGAPVALQVNSRAYGTLTLVLLIVAGSVLVLMVVIRIVQRTRTRRSSRRAGGDGRPDDPDGGPEGPDGPDDGRTPLTATEPPGAASSLPAGRTP